MNIRFLSFACVLGLGLSVGSVGCSGQVVPIGEIEKPVTGDDAGPGPGPGLPGPGGTNPTIDDGPWEVPDCAEPSGESNTYTSIADTEAKIEGVWALCSGRVNSPADTKGIAFAKGRASFLVQARAAAGPSATGSQLQKGQGPDYERSVELIDTQMMNGPGHFQINLSANGGTNMYASRTSKDGRFLELNEGTSGNRGRYVRVTRRVASTCATPLGPLHAYTSIADVEARIAGRWQVCTGGISSPADTKGLEIAQRRAYFLVQGASGLERKASWDYERSVSIIDATSMNGPGSYQINLSDGGGTNMYFTRITEAGDRLELDEGTSGKKVSLVRIP